MIVQAQLHPAEEWVEVTTFEWWAPPSADDMGRYIAYRNEPPREI